jgi:hypothetical protein
MRYLGEQPQFREQTAKTHHIRIVHFQTTDRSAGYPGSRDELTGLRRRPLEVIFPRIETWIEEATPFAGGRIGTINRSRLVGIAVWACQREIGQFTITAGCTRSDMIDRESRHLSARWKTAVLAATTRPPHNLGAERIPHGTHGTLSSSGQIARSRRSARSASSFSSDRSCVNAIQAKSSACSDGDRNSFRSPSSRIRLSRAESSE